MTRTLALALIVALMGSTAAMAQPGQNDPRGGPQDQQNCGHPGQPKCDQPDKPKDEKKDEKKNDGPGRGRQDGPPPAQHNEPPAGGAQSGPPPGQQNQPPVAGRQGNPPGDQHDQTARDRDRTPPVLRGQQGMTPRYSRGDRIPEQYRRDQFNVTDWQRNNLPRPPSGYRWMCYDRGNCFLVATRTGVIRQTLWREDRDRYWRQRYSRTYTYNDDLYYRECRSRPDPAGILIGGLIGGLIGRSVGDDRAGATFAGIIIGGAIGGALTRDMDCEDRSYAYHTYYDAFNSGRVGRVYNWRNPRNRHHGEFRVKSYYYDDYGFHCANYTHVVWLDRKRQSAGRACRQPDGAWAFLN